MTSSNRPALGFVGPGTVGTALARAFAAAGYEVVALYGRSAERLARVVEVIPGARAAESA